MTKLRDLLGNKLSTSLTLSFLFTVLGTAWLFTDNSFAQIMSQCLIDLLGGFITILAFTLLIAIFKTCSFLFFIDKIMTFCLDWTGI